MDFPNKQNLRPGRVSRAGIYVTPSTLFLHAVVDVFPAGIGQKHRPVVSFAGFHGAQALYLCFSVFEQSGCDLRGERLAPLLKKSVILPHDKLTGPVSTVIVFLALIDRLAAAGADAHRLPLRLEQLLSILRDVGIILHQFRCHRRDPVHEVLR